MQAKVNPHHQNDTPEWRVFLTKAYASRPRITSATVTVTSQKVTIDWSGPITANGKAAGDNMTWPENDAWTLIHNLTIAQKAPAHDRGM